MIYVDCDDVIAESTSSYVDVIKREFGIDKKFDDITSFDLKESFELTQEQYLYFFDIIHSPNELLKFSPVKGAVDTINKWFDCGYEIDIITGRLTKSLEPTLEWLAYNGVKYSNFIIVDKYNRAEMDRAIAKPLSFLDDRFIDFAVEDSLFMANYLSEKLNVRVALLDKPWNRKGFIGDNITRVYDWSDISLLFESTVKNS